MARIPYNPFGELLTDCSSDCEAYAACGGYQPTAPCGCAWPYGHEKRKKCDQCYLMCRDRPDFVARLSEGKHLEQITLKKDQLPDLPLFIPLDTHEFRGANSVLPVQWAAADLREIFNPKTNGPATIKPHFSTALLARNYLHVDTTCQLIAILNGTDKVLESFWNMDRSLSLSQLKEIGFSLGTGPTFSVTEKTTLGTRTPYSHHTVMLMRHHLVIDQIQEAGMTAAPNLYWLDGDRQQMKRWGDWLAINPFIRIVSREFMLSRDRKTVARKIAELLEILSMAQRSFHVLVVGTGTNNGPFALRELFNAGHTASLVTAAPIIQGNLNLMYRLGQSGQILAESTSDQKLAFHELVLNNVLVMNQALQAVVKK